MTFVGTAAGPGKVIQEGFARRLIRSAGLRASRQIGCAARRSPLSAIDAWSAISRRRPSIAVGVGGHSGPCGGAGRAAQSDALMGRTCGRDQPPCAWSMRRPTAVRFFGTRRSSRQSLRPGFSRPAPVHAPNAGVGPTAGGPGADLRRLSGCTRHQHGHGGSGGLLAGGPPLAITPDGGATSNGEGPTVGPVNPRVEPFLFSMDRGEVGQPRGLPCRGDAGGTDRGGTSVVLIPLPFYRRYQRKNARALVGRGRAGDAEPGSWAAAVTDDPVSGDGPGPPPADGTSQRGGSPEPDAARVIAERIMSWRSDERIRRTGNRYNTERLWVRCSVARAVCTSSVSGGSG